VAAGAKVQDGQTGNRTQRESPRKEDEEKAKAEAGGVRAEKVTSPIPARKRRKPRRSDSAK
jgi:hypothetical protein